MIRILRELQKMPLDTKFDFLDIFTLTHNIAIFFNN